MNARKNIRKYRILVRRGEEGLRSCSALVDRKWKSVLAKGGGQRKDSTLLESELSSSFCAFEQSKDTQEVQSILHCKTMYCYWKGFTEYIHHVGKELKSIVNHGLIPRGVYGESDG